MRRRSVRLTAAVATAVGAGLLLLPAAVPAGQVAAPAAVGPAAVGPAAISTTRTAYETEVVEASDERHAVARSTTTQYRVATTTTCRRTSAGRACRDSSVRVVAEPTTRTAATMSATSSTAYGFMAKDSAGRPAHWNRCSLIRYRVNTAALPSTSRATALSEVHAAMTKLGAAHGLKFDYAGSTTVVPYTTDWGAKIPSTQPAEIYLAWSTEAKVPALAGSIAGLGGPSYSTGGSREPRVVRGGVTLDVAAKVAPGFGTGATRGALLLHEIGHAANLAHVSDKYQVMYPSLTSVSRGDYQTGDKAGLAKLRSYPCF
jgi:hypothetical protein